VDVSGMWASTRSFSRASQASLGPPTDSSTSSHPMDPSVISPSSKAFLIAGRISVGQSSVAADARLLQKRSEDRFASIPVNSRRRR